MKVVLEGKDIKECSCKTGGAIAEEFIWALEKGWIALFCDICKQRIELKDIVIFAPRAVQEDPIFYHLDKKCFKEWLAKNP
jgi:hypothetical protein